jgi:hypothetical protein
MFREAHIYHGCVAYELCAFRASKDIYCCIISLIFHLRFEEQISFKGFIRDFQLFVLQNLIN